jgi:hypothetical protein
MKTSSTSLKVKSTKGLDDFIKSLAMNSEERNRVLGVSIVIRHGDTLDINQVKKGIIENVTDASCILKPPFFDDSCPSYYLIKNDKQSDSFFLIMFLPKTCSIKDRLVYATAKRVLCGVFIGITVRNGGEFSDVNDIDLSTPDRQSMLSRQEIEKEEAMKAMENEREERQAVAARSAIKNNIQDLDECVKASLYEFGNLCAGASQENDKLTELFISPDNQASLLIGATKTIILPPEKQFPVTINEPRYYLYRFGGFNQKCCLAFIYYCPSSAKPKDKMIYSSSKSSALETLSAFLKKKFKSSFALELDIYDEEEMCKRFIISELNNLSNSQKAPEKKSRILGLALLGTKKPSPSSEPPYIKKSYQKPPPHYQASFNYSPVKENIRLKKIESSNPKKITGNDFSSPRSPTNADMDKPVMKFLRDKVSSEKKQFAVTPKVSISSVLDFVTASNDEKINESCDSASRCIISQVENISPSNFTSDSVISDEDVQREMDGKIKPTVYEEEIVNEKIPENAVSNENLEIIVDSLEKSTKEGVEKNNVVSYCDSLDSNESDSTDFESVNSYLSNDRLKSEGNTYDMVESLDSLEKDKNYINVVSPAEDKIDENMSENDYVRISQEDHKECGILDNADSHITIEIAVSEHQDLEVLPSNAGPLGFCNVNDIGASSSKETFC